MSRDECAAAQSDDDLRHAEEVEDSLIEEADRIRQDESSAATLRWHYEDGTWWAESPEFPEWSGGASSLDEARLLAHEGLRFCAENDALTITDPFGELPASVTW